MSSGGQKVSGEKSPRPAYETSMFHTQLGQKVSGEKSPRPVPQRFITATSRLVCGLAVCTRASTAAVTGTSCLRTTLIPSTRRGIAKTSAENQNDVRRDEQIHCPFPVVSPARPLALE